MSNETEGWTYTSEDGTYSVGEFTEEGKIAFVLLLETDREIQATKKTLAKLEMAVKGFNTNRNGTTNGGHACSRRRRGVNYNITYAYIHWGLRPPSFI